MDKLLHLQLNNNPFPSADEQIEIATFKYSAKRMGNAPIISATIDFPRCLDSEWTEDVYVEFRGEKFFLKDTPSSSYSNTSCLYKHTAEFVSERTILETVYFFDVVKTDTTDDKPVSNNSTFSFSGNLEQFAQRLQRSMSWSGIDYTVVVDPGIPLEDKFNEFNDQFIFDALKSIYDTYGVPFYFKGKKIHIGYADNLVTAPLEYGVDNSLISIKRNRENSSIINRVTARGSERNITYYYPNPTPKGTIALGGPSASKYHISDLQRFCSKIDLDKEFTLHYPIGEVISSDDKLNPKWNNGWAYNSIELSDINSSIALRATTSFVAKNAGTSPINTVPISIYVKLNGVPIQRISDYFAFSGTLKATDSDAVWDVTLIHGSRNSFTFFTSKSIQYTKREFVLDISLSQKKSFPEGSNLYIHILPNASYYWVKDEDVDTIFYEAREFYIDTDIEVTDYDRGGTYISHRASYLSKHQSLKLISGEVFSNEGKVSDVIPLSDNLLSLGDIPLGKYRVRSICSIHNTSMGLYSVITVNTKWETRPKWLYVDSENIIDIEDSGIQINNGYSVERGDTLVQELVKRVNVQNNLMPPIYRATDGRERFYNAENGEYKDENGDDIVFSNPYSESRAREFIYEDDEIYPSITGMKNSAGLPIDVIEEFAFDDKDNDDIYPVGHEREGKYMHPYFFAKLRKFDGEHGFNLFDHAIEGQPMTISMTSGNCAACNFTIGVDEEYDYNPVQVDSNGNLMRDEDGNVLCGRKTQPQADKINSQNDTQNNSVWIALKKEEQTFGIIMPNATNNYRPAAGDTFVILNIDLPDAYVFAAEERLKDAAIKHMAENNDYKFNYSVELSRIFFEENTDFASKISENSKAIVRYNDKEEEMFVSSYSYDMSNSSPLPKVTIELNNDIKIVKNAIDKATGLIGATVGKLENRFQLSFNNTDKKIDNISYKGDDIKSQLMGVEASVDKVSQDVSDIQDDRETYEIESSFIESEYDTINKEFDLFVAQWGEYIDANGLAYKDKNGVIYLCRASNSVFDQFKHSYSKYLNELNKVINSKGKVVFTPEYSIAKSDYYIARTAMSKAISTQTRQEISDLDYLKGAFGADNVLDSDGVVLSQLVSVKDKDGNVVAGIYGGANDTLNGNGFESTAHGTLMQFAGADNAQSVDSANFRVYGDGTMYANKGVFSGFVRKTKTIITSKNIDDFVDTFPYFEQGSLVAKIGKSLNLDKAGTFIEFGENVDWGTLFNRFVFPYFEVGGALLDTYPLEYMLSILGTTIVVSFKTGTFGDVSCIEIKKPTSEGLSGTCLRPTTNDILVATCVAEMNTTDNTVVIGWDWKFVQTI